MMLTRSRCSPNHLRHTAAAFAIHRGATVYDVQRMLGHAKPSITLDTYGYLWDTGQSRLAETLEAAIREGQAMQWAGGELGAIR